MFPLTEYCPPLGSYRICIKGILKDTSLSSNGNKSSSRGLGVQAFPLRTDNFASIANPFFIFNRQHISKKLFAFHSIV